MDSTGKSLLGILFNEGETICVSPNEFAYHSIPLENAFEPTITLVPPDEERELSYCDSKNLLMVAINPIKGWRRDSSVTSFRSFLLELDSGSIQEQLGYIDKLGVPFSAQVFSGNKSIHTVITLDEDLKDEKTYRYTADWIFNVVAHADKNCRNPSRSIRIPGAYREPGKKQRLFKINKRISQKELADWLNKFTHLKPQVKPKKEIPGEADYNRLSPWCRAMLTKGIDFKKGRNQTWYALAVDFALAGFSEDEAIQTLSKFYNEERDFKEKEWLKSINQGFKRIQEG
jgi:hypothetical protein